MATSGLPPVRRAWLAAIGPLPAAKRLPARALRGAAQRTEDRAPRDLEAIGDVVHAQPGIKPHRADLVVALAVDERAHPTRDVVAAARQRTLQAGREEVTAL